MCDIVLDTDVIERFFLSLFVLALMLFLLFTLDITFL